MISAIAIMFAAVALAVSAIVIVRVHRRTAQLAERVESRLEAVIVHLDRAGRDDEDAGRFADVLDHNTRVLEILQGLFDDHAEPRTPPLRLVKGGADEHAHPIQPRLRTTNSRPDGEGRLEPQRPLEVSP